MNQDSREKKAQAADWGSLVSTIVRKSEGSIQVKDSKKGGTRFDIRLQCDSGIFKPLKK